MRRRNFMLGCTAFMAMAPTMAAAVPGTGASQGLEDAFWKVQGVQVGAGGGPVHVLFAPWCAVSRELWNDAAAFTDRLSFRWIPFSGGQPEGSVATEMILMSPFPSIIPSAFMRAQTGSGTGATPMADAQDRAVETHIEPLVIRDSGGGLVSPILVYRLRDGRVRVIRGGIGPAHLEEVANAV